MNGEFFEALALLEKEKGIPMEYLLEKIKNAIAIAIKRVAEAVIIKYSTKALQLPQFRF